MQLINSNLIELYAHFLIFLHSHVPSFSALFLTYKWQNNIELIIYTLIISIRHLKKDEIISLSTRVLIPCSSMLSTAW